MRHVAEGSVYIYCPVWPQPAATLTMRPQLSFSLHESYFSSRRTTLPKCIRREVVMGRAITPLLLDLIILVVLFMKSGSNEICWAT